MPDEAVTGESITELLRRASAGDQMSAARVMPLVYDALHRMAQRRVGDPDAPLGATSLVHETYLKLFRGDELSLTSRSHFYALASTAMRQIMVDKARALQREKRGGGVALVTLDEAVQSVESQCATALALDEAIDRLDDFEPRLKRVVECRFFGGLTEEETAVALGVSSRTIRSDWVKARALLRGWLE